MKRRAIMVVMNSLHTDARVQRAAEALSKEYELLVVGINTPCNDIKTYKQKIIRVNVDSGIKRYLYFEKKVKKILNKEEYELFYAHDYFSASLVSWVKKKKPKIKVVYDSHELIIPEKNIKLNLRNYFFYMLEKEAISCADLVFCASEARARIMEKHYGCSSIIPIENISELERVNDSFSKNLCMKYREFFEKPGVTLVYAGVLYRGRKIDKLIDIVNKQPSAKLLIIGDGPDLERLKVIAFEKIVDRVCFTGTLPYKYLSVLLEKSDIGYISYPVDSLNNKYCAPNKIFEYASVRLPMISPWNPTIEEFFTTYKIGCIGNDLEEAFIEVSKSLAMYKENCVSFSKIRNWKQQEQVLLDSIKQLF